MVYFDAPVPAERPGFTVFDMIQEWTDHLEVNEFGQGGDGTHRFDAGLIAELVNMHVALFRDSVHQHHIHWNDFTGELFMDYDLALRVEAGVEERPSRELVDELWADAFQLLSDNIFEIQDDLKNRS